MEPQVQSISDEPAQIAQYQATPKPQVATKYVEYCSLDIEKASKADKLRVFNAMKTCTGLVKDHIGDVVELEHVYFKTFYSNKDGKDKARVVLFLATGETLVSGSFPLMNSLMQLMRTFGEPKTWDEPMKLKLTTQKLKNGEAFGFEIVE